jgi:hypothetical protein
METEITLGEIYGDRAARGTGTISGTSLEFHRFREVLNDYPGYHALKYAFNATLNTLCAEDARLEATEKRAPRGHSRRARKLRKAA